MPLTHAYPDLYLKAQVTEDREARAIADIADLGTLPASWVARLVVLRAYVIACMECQQKPDDLFAAKLATYRKEYEVAVSQARAAQAVAEQGSGAATGGASFLSIALVRS